MQTKNFKKGGTPIVDWRHVGEDLRANWSSRQGAVLVWEKTVLPSERHAFAVGLKGQCEATILFLQVCVVELGLF